jgi:glycosyltransferase involved in cell wall biosynthesis
MLKSPAMKPLVSVIIPNFNYAKYVGEAIDSALAQTYANIEVIVVDDGSTDTSPTIIESYGDKIKAIFQNNQGVSTARNNAVAASHGEYLAFLDADDVWLASKIEMQIERFAGNESIGLVHVGVEEIDAEGNHLGQMIDGMEGRVSDELLLFRRPVILGGCSGAMITREAFDLVGGFDPRLSTSADWDLFYRVGKASEAGFISDILFRYRMHGENMHGNIERMEREMLIGFQKAFANPDPHVQRLRAQAYGNLYKVLAGSYFRSGQYGRFLVQAIKSLWQNPRNLGYFVSYPKRLFGRRQ